MHCDQWTDVKILAGRVLRYLVLIAHYGARAIKGQSRGWMLVLLVREPSAHDLLPNLVVVVALRFGLPHPMLREHFTLVTLLLGQLQA